MTLRSLAFTLCLVMGLAFGGGVLAQPVQSAEEKNAAKFSLIWTKVKQHNAVQLYNGEEVKPAQRLNWEALIFAAIPKQDWTGKPVLGSDGKLAVIHCTASLIGPRTVLMAAHCIDAGTFQRNAYINLDGGGRLKLTCAMPDAYLKQDGGAASAYMPGSVRNSDDFALCALTEPLPRLRDGFRYETIETAQPLRKQETVLISGFGCNGFDVEDGELRGRPGDGKFRIGTVAIEGPPPGMGRDAYYSYARSSFKSQPALCPGDSGGPVMTGTAPLNGDLAERVIRAVNSSIRAVQPGKLVDAMLQEKAPDIISNFADLGTDGFRTFLNGWAPKPTSDNYICGYIVKKGERACR